MRSPRGRRWRGLYPADGGEPGLRGSEPEAEERVDGVLRAAEGSGGHRAAEGADEQSHAGSLFGGGRVEPRARECDGACADVS